MIEIIDDSVDNVIACHSCGKSLMHWRKYANADISHILIFNCPFCNSSDMRMTIDGLFQYIGIMNEESRYSTIITEIEDLENNTWRFTVEQR